MRNDLTELVFILDRSGSMAGLESDTIGGFNSLIQKQRAQAGEALVTTVLFDDKHELLHDRVSLALVAPLSEREYFVRGTTALLDAIGGTVNRIVQAHRHAVKAERPGKVMFIITTDGYENASREYRLEAVKKLIEHQKRRYGWEFLFLGANIDAVSTASRIGIGANRTVNYHADSRGTALNYEVLSKTVSCMRMGNAIPEDWKNDIEADFACRHRD